MCMYKRFYIFLLIALTFASCTKEETVRDVAVQFITAVSPDLTAPVKGAVEQTETVIADHAVLQAWRGDVMMAQAEQDITSGTAQIFFSDIKLAGGSEYTIYIWADCKDYYNTSDLRNVSLNTEKSYNGMSQKFDAFYACTSITCGLDDEVHNVILKRPFAKITFSAAVTKDVQISFSAPTSLNLKTGKVSDTRNFNYTVSHGDSGVGTFDYVFADEGVSQMDYTFNLEGCEEKTETVPVSRNTKTNIMYNVNN